MRETMKEAVRMIGGGLGYQLTSAELLMNFARYCKLKQGCPHLDKQGSICTSSTSSGACRFSSCPLVTGGVVRE